MSRLEDISKQVSEHMLPPVERWNPSLCTDIDIVIRQDGSWVHEGGVIQRLPLVKLFASILKKENNDYYLVTPVEKAKIVVENTPFIVVSAQRIEDRWFMTNNLNEVVELTNQCQLSIEDDQNPRLIWRSGLEARVNQSVMYQWQMYALDHGGLVEHKLWLTSGADQILIAQDS